MLMGRTDSYGFFAATLDNSVMTTGGINQASSMSYDFSTLPAKA
jgi:hypothetical protein